MGEESLMLKVKRFYEDINVERTSEGLKFSLLFESYKIRDPCSKKVYGFPEGHVAVIYDSKHKHLGFPFVEEKYSHPCLPKFDVKKQTVDIGPHFYEKDIKHLSVEKKVLLTLRMAKRVLTEHAAGCEYAWHRISSKAFDKYKLG